MSDNIDGRMEGPLWEAFVAAFRRRAGRAPAPLENIKDMGAWIMFRDGAEASVRLELAHGGQQGYGRVIWLPGDVLSAALDADRDLTEEQAEAFLRGNASYLRDYLVEKGNMWLATEIRRFAPEGGSCDSDDVEDPET